MIKCNPTSTSPLRISNEIQEMPAILWTIIIESMKLWVIQQEILFRNNIIKRNFHIFIYCFCYLRRNKWRVKKDVYKLSWKKRNQKDRFLYIRMSPFDCPPIESKSIELNNHLMYALHKRQQLAIDLSQCSHDEEM